MAGQDLRWADNLLVEKTGITPAPTKPIRPAIREPFAGVWSGGNPILRRRGAGQCVKRVEL
jgi:hypothetical protein